MIASHRSSNAPQPSRRARNQGSSNPQPKRARTQFKLEHRYHIQYSTAQHSTAQDDATRKKTRRTEERKDLCGCPRLTPCPFTFTPPPPPLTRIFALPSSLCLQRVSVPCPVLPTLSSCLSSHSLSVFRPVVPFNKRKGERRKKPKERTKLLTTRLFRVYTFTFRLTATGLTVYNSPVHLRAQHR